MKSLKIDNNHPNFSWNKILKIDICEQCDAYGVEQRRIQGFGCIPEGRNHLEDPGVDGK